MPSPWPDPVTSSGDRRSAGPSTPCWAWCSSRSACASRPPAGDRGALRGEPGALDRRRGGGHAARRGVARRRPAPAPRAPPPVIEGHFGESPALSIGVEEEVMLLDAESLAPVPAVGQLLADGEGDEHPGRLKTELPASIVELNTDVCATVDEAVEALAALRGRASELLERRGLRLAAAGSHPFAEPEDLAIVDEKRYREFVGYAGVTARRQGVSGVHVHVGMPSADEAPATLETILPWLSLVLALSANSPYLAGKATGLASNRAEILAQLPRSGAPPVFGSYAEWEAWIGRFIGTGLASSYTQFWWDVRLHPNFGTLEVRMPDQPTALDVTAAFI